MLLSHDKVQFFGLTTFPATCFQKETACETRESATVTIAGDGGTTCPFGAALKDFNMFIRTGSPVKGIAVVGDDCKRSCFG